MQKETILVISIRKKSAPRKRKNVKFRAGDCGGAELEETPTKRIPGRRSNIRAGCLQGC